MYTHKPARYIGTPARKYNNVLARDNNVRACAHNNIITGVYVYIRACAFIMYACVRYMV